jgi:hypothetical protein
MTHPTPGYLIPWLVRRSPPSLTKQLAELCIRHGIVLRPPDKNLLETPMNKTALFAAAFVLLAAPALAQSVGEKTGVNSALSIAPKTNDFVAEAAQSDMFEIQSSKLASSKTRGDVQTFANQMLH